MDQFEIVDESKKKKTVMLSGENTRQFQLYLCATRDAINLRVNDHFCSHAFFFF